MAWGWQEESAGLQWGVGRCRLLDPFPILASRMLFMTELVLFVVGLVLLVGGAELLVGSASRLALVAGISPLVIGLTVVAFGTSAPELAISVQASWSGRADLAIGNVVGSNICNVLLILGLSALVAPLAVGTQLVRWEVPLMIGVSVCMWLLALNGTVSTWDGLLLLSGGLAYVVFTVRRSRRQTALLPPAQDADGLPQASPRLGWSGIALQLAWMLAGLAMLVLGSRWLVGGAVALARLVGLNELVIGLTIVAVGTSLPEIATSVLASVRGARDIAVGNVVGSNLFNILLVLGSAAVVAPQGVAVPSAALALDIPVMTVVALACLPIFFTGHRIDRWEGGMFLGYYVAYTAYLVLAARQHAALAAYSAVMLWFVIPLTAVTLVILVVRWSVRHPRQPA